LIGRVRLRAADLPFTVFLVYELILKLGQGEREMITYWRPATSGLLALSSPVRLVVHLVDFEPPGSRAVELVTGAGVLWGTHHHTLALTPNRQTRPGLIPFVLMRCRTPLRCYTSSR
jgi:hypothetical protein